MPTRSPRCAAARASRARTRSRKPPSGCRAERNFRSISYLDQGLMDAQSLLVLDLEKCTRCDQCVRACADAHDGVTRLLRDGLRFDHFLVATSCRQCKDPLCMVGCPGRLDPPPQLLEVIIEDWCVGCGLCATTAPTATSTCTRSNVVTDMPGLAGQEKSQR